MIFGLALACGVADAATEGAGDGDFGTAEACGDGVVIGPAGTGFFCDNSATVNFMA